MNGELEQLGERIAEQAAHLDAAMHRLLTDLREFDARGGWRAQGAETCAHWLAWRVGWDPVTARDHVRVARKLAEFALIDDALRRGELSYSKVRALLRVATPENEALLLDHARLMTASQLEKLCRLCRARHRRHNTESRIIRRACADGVQDRRTCHEPAALLSALSGKSGPGENQKGPPPSDGHGHVLRDRDGRPSTSQRRARRTAGRVRSLALGLWIQSCHGSPVSPGGGSLQSVARRQRPG
jgi:hypothetical protein